MTEEELEKKAEEYAENAYFKKHQWATDNRYNKQKTIRKMIYIDGFIDGYEQGQKDNTSLMASFKERELLKLHQDYEQLDKEKTELEEQVEDWKADHEYNLQLMIGLNEQIDNLKLEIKNNANCLNCSLYGSPYCKRNTERYAPCKKWKSENSMIYDINALGQKIDRRHEC